MKISAKKIRKLFHKYNELYFSGRLSEPYIKVIKKGYVMGDWNPWTETLRISKYYNKDKEDLHSTLLHEMVHMWQSTFVPEFANAINADRDLSKEQHKADRWHTHEFIEFKNFFADFGILI